MSDSERRNKTINKQVRMTPEEFDEIKSKADAFGLSIPQYLRDCAMDRPLRNMAEHLAVRELAQSRADLNRLGGLLKLWLTGEMKSPDPYLKDIRVLLKDLEAAANSVQKAIIDLGVNRRSTPNGSEVKE